MIQAHPSTGNPASPKRTAAQRVLALLGAFADSRDPLTLSEISRRADLSLTTTHRLIREVLQWGGLEVDDTGRYRLSRKILGLACSSTGELRARELALPHLVDLHRRTGLTVHLAAPDGDEVMYLEALRAHPNYTGENRIGGHLPLHVTATGMVLLAFADPLRVDDYLSRPLKRYTEHTLTGPTALRGALAQIRCRRYAHLRGALAPGAGAIAAPVTDRSGCVGLAVGVVYARQNGEPLGLADLVRATARRIERAMNERPTLDPRTVAFNRVRAGLA